MTKKVGKVRSAYQIVKGNYRRVKKGAANVRKETKLAQNVIGGTYRAVEGVSKTRLPFKIF